MRSREANVKNPKRRRLQGSCDICRQKKIRCDSSKMPNNRCSNCIAFNVECTHIHITQKTIYSFKPKRDIGPSESYASHREKMKPLLKAIMLPTYQAPTNPALIRNTLVSLASYARLLEETIAELSATTSSQYSDDTQINSEISSLCRINTGRAEDLIQECDEDDGETLANDMQTRLTLDPSNSRFFGPSSSGALVKDAIEFSGQSRFTPSAAMLQEFSTKFRRPKYWSVHRWEIMPTQPRQTLIFPEPDLLRDLVDLYFRHCNLHLPILHQPTFKRSLDAGLHLKDSGFGGTVLAVCANASRYSNDKRVFPEGITEELSCGYHWFRQLRLFRESFFQPPSLYELQTYFLAITYLHGTSAPEVCWYLIGMSIRAAQEVGIHRRTKTSGPPTLQSELQKRIWWALVLADIVISIAVGRPPAVHSSDYDVDLPIDCDDEYWEASDPSLAFKQPPGKPSTVASFIKTIEVFNILRSAEKTFYSTKPQPSTGNVSQAQEDWKRLSLADLDSSLNAWVDSIPEHVRWDPNREDAIFFDQSALLLSSFYWVQIMVHRPFIATVNRLSPSSVAICTNAARACSRVMETTLQRGFLGLPQVQAAVFQSGLILLLSVWNAQKAQIPIDTKKEMEGVFRCVRIISMFERRWHPAGRFNDTLRALSAAIHLPCSDSLDPNDPNDHSGISISKCQIPAKETVQDGNIMSNSLPETFEFPLHSSELSKPIFQTYQQSDAGTNISFADDFEAIFSQPPLLSANQIVPMGSLEALHGPFTGISSGDPLSLSVHDMAHGFNMVMDQDDVAFWASIPTSFDWSAWDSYLRGAEPYTQNHDSITASSIPL